MDNTSPARWLAIWPAHMKRERYEWELPYFGAEQDGLFYHNGGCAHMPFHVDDVVLRDYGVLTADEWYEHGGDDQWDADFPPVSSPATDYDKYDAVESWIDPGGVVYLCLSEHHEELAERLCKKLGFVEPNDYLSRPGDLLYKRGWIKLYWNNILDRFDLAQKQLDALFDIFLVLKNKKESEQLCASISEVLGMKLTSSSDGAIASAPRDEKYSVEAAVAAQASALVEQKEELPAASSLVHGPTQSDQAAGRKPFVLTDQPYVEITVRAYCTMEKLPNGCKRGVSCFKTFCTDVVDDDDNKYGMIGGGTGFVTLSDSRRSDDEGGGEFFIRHSDLWYAYQRGLKARFGGDFQDDEGEDKLLDDGGSK